MSSTATNKLTARLKSGASTRTMLAAVISIAVVGTGYAAVTRSQSTNMTNYIVAVPTSFAAFSALMLGGSTSVTPAPVKPAPVVTAPPPPPTQPAQTPSSTTGTQLGINLNFQTYWSGQRSFSNLLYGSGWAAIAEPSKGSWWGPMPVDRVDENGIFKFLKPGEFAIKAITPPPALRFGKSVQIRCTFVGKGAISVGNGPVSNIQGQTNGMTFTWNPTSGKAPTDYVNAVHLQLTATDPANPVRQIDCREATASPEAFFDPAFMASLAQYKLVRFMDWQGTNGNATLTWAKRATPKTEGLVAGGGPPIEYMVALANDAGVDPWFSMSWNADDDYVRRFATYVRDNVNPSRRIYVELSNEVWNSSFPVYRQAANEGLAAKLSTNEFQAAMFRYAQKHAAHMKIWTEVFAQQPSRLVRVASSMNASAWVAKQILSFPGTAQYVDALATAPYFGYDTFTGANATVTNLDTLFAVTKASIDKTMTAAQGNADLAAQYKKRFIAYEAGQHLISPNDERHIVMNRDPRIGQLYSQYLAAWKAKFNDMMVLYSDTGSYSKYGTFPMMEYPGQPLSQAPKAAAVKAFASTLK